MSAFGQIFEWFRPYKYIRAGERVLLSGNGYPSPFYSKVVEVDGWAAKLQGGGAIRKDLIRRNAKGEWFYVY